MYLYFKLNSKFINISQPLCLNFETIPIDLRKLPNAYEHVNTSYVSNTLSNVILQKHTDFTFISTIYICSKVQFDSCVYIYKQNTLPCMGYL